MAMLAVMLCLWAGEEQRWVFMFCEDWKNSLREAWPYMYRHRPESTHPPTNPSVGRQQHPHTPTTASTAARNNYTQPHPPCTLASTNPEAAEVASTFPAGDVTVAEYVSPAVSWHAKCTG